MSDNKLSETFAKILIGKSIVVFRIILGRFRRYILGY